MENLKALGNKVTEFQGFDTFPKPKYCDRVLIESAELTAKCPATGQPDYYKVTIGYAPSAVCVESKTIKLYLMSFRDKGMFCEAMAEKIAKDFSDALECPVEVELRQKSRGGVKLTATARYHPGYVVRDILDSCEVSPSKETEESCSVCKAAMYCPKFGEYLATKEADANESSENGFKAD